MNRNMRIQASTSLPILHVCAIPELFRQMIDAILPLVKIHPAEAAPGFDVLSLRLPCVHTGDHLATVHESQMLSKMVFPVERSRLWAFIVTSRVIVSCQMVLAWIQLVAVYTSRLAGSLVGDDLTNGRA
jgi:hypothetical protein